MIDIKINRLMKSIKQCFRVEEDYLFKLIYDHELWETSIRPKLVRMAKQKIDDRQIIENINYFRSKTNGDNIRLSMNQLTKAYKAELPKIFHNISKFILARQKRKFGIKFFRKNQYPYEHKSANGIKYDSYTFSKEEVVLLLCMMAMMLIIDQQPYQFSQASDRNFAYIFTNQQFKTRTIIQYLKKQTKNQFLFPEHLQIKRSASTISFQKILSQNDHKMGIIEIEKNGVSIEQFFGAIKIDFANQYIGGGALWAGNLQEEIMFGNHPEMFISMLLCQVMKDNQALTFIGFKKYFCNKGYGHTCEFDKEEQHKYTYDKQKRAIQVIAAIDAIHLSGNQDYQYEKKAIDREILKAYVGFTSQNVAQISTGNWGCGAFRGNLQLKLLIQWIASSLCKKKLIYCPFTEYDRIFNKQIFEILSQKSIKESYGIVLKACKLILNSKQPISVYESVKKVFGE